MLKWLNPLNWVKSGIAAKVEKEVDAKLSKDFLVEKCREVLNYLVALTESSMNDEKVRAISADLIYCGNTLTELGDSISPDGDEGRKFSPAEIAALQARVQVLFGDVISDEQLANWRDAIKVFICEKIGV